MSVTRGMRIDPANTNLVPGEIQVFQHGAYNHFGNEDGFTYRTTFDALFVGDTMNDRISSIIVYSGRWVFYEHGNYNESGNQPGFAVELGPGYYADVEQQGIRHDAISSWRQVA